MPDASLSALEQILIRADLDRPTFHADEVGRLPAETWTAVLDSGLVAETENAGYAECDCSWDVHDEDVCYAPAESAWAGRPYISCPEAGVVWLAPERLRQWSVDLGRLTTALAAALTCAGRVEELVPGCLWLLGRTAIGGRSREVFFARKLSDPRGGPAAVEACARFQGAVAPFVLVPQVIPRRDAWARAAPRVLALTSLATLEKRALLIDRAFLESACREGGEVVPDAPPAPTPAFATPRGAAWSDVEIRFNDVHTVSVRVREERGVFHYAQMGMADRRSTMPTEQWKLLRTFAEAPGNVLDWTSRDARRKNKKRCEKLVGDLTRFFGIDDGTPIAYSKPDKGWRALVRLSA